MIPMNRTRIAVAVLAMAALSFASAAQAEAIVGRVVGSVVGAVVANAIIKGRHKTPQANCRLYDREGMEVYLPCDATRPLGELVTSTQTAAAVAAPAPVAVGVAPLPAVDGRVQTVAQLDGGAAAYAAANGLPANARPGDCFARAEVQWARRSCDDVVYDAPAPVHQAPPIRYAPAPVVVSRPVEADCDCHHEVRDERVYAARPVASFLSAQGGYTETTYGPGRVVAVYDSYEESSSSSVSYSESSSSGYGYAHGGGFGGGLSGGVGYGDGFYAYGASGYGAGGYADDRYPRSRVAGRDPNGFLTWPGKRVR